MLDKEWEHRSAMSGTSVNKLKQAMSTFQNDVGPGKYALVNLTGGNVSTSTKFNVPKYSVGLPRKTNIVNPETRNSILSPHLTPSAYPVPTDNIYFNKNRVSHKQTESKFFSPKNMPAIRDGLPHQYTAQDGVSCKADNLGYHTRGSKISI